MNIGSLSSNIPQTELKTQIDTAVLSMSLETVEESGEAMIKMMEQSVTPHIGQNFDVSV